MNKDGKVDILRESDLSGQEQEEFRTMVRTLMDVDAGKKESRHVSPGRITQAVTGL